MDKGMAWRGRHLAEWLNSENSWGSSEESKQRTLSFILQLASLRENARKGVKLEKKEKDSINAALRRYPWVLQLQGVTSAGVPGFAEDESEGDEAQTYAKMAIDLTRANLLARLRKCAHCQLWFFAKRPEGEYCSRNCYLANYRTTEKFKALNRKHQRQFYERHYSANRKGKHNAKKR
jgi:hypothetical protein